MGLNGGQGPIIIVTGSSNSSPNPAPVTHRHLAPPAYHPAMVAPPVRCLPTPISRDVSMCGNGRKGNGHKKTRKDKLLKGVLLAISLLSLGVLCRNHLPSWARFWEPEVKPGYKLELPNLNDAQAAAHHSIQADMEAGKCWEDIKGNTAFDENISKQHLFQNAIDAHVKYSAGQSQYAPHPDLLKHMCSDTQGENALFKKKDIQEGVERMLYSGHDLRAFEPCYLHENFNLEEKGDDGRSLEHALERVGMGQQAEKVRRLIDTKQNLQQSQP